MDVGKKSGWNKGKRGGLRALHAGPTDVWPPLSPMHLADGPTNEAGVLFLFGMLAGSLGFVVTRIQSEFPDCEALRQVGEER